MKKTLFYPITCNPPHFGHVSAVKIALENLAFDEVWIFPSGKRVDKDILTSSEDRKNLSLLFVDYLQNEVSILVVAMTGAVDGTNDRYTHEIILEIKSHVGNEMFQLCGTDGFTGIKERAIEEDENFVIIKRLGYEILEELSKKRNLIILDGDTQEISSTEIREMVKNGDKSCKKLVPESIASYIEERELYR